jgi:hypothetical protein
MLLYFVPFALICVILIGAAVVRPRLIYEYPYFMAATFTVFILPQAYALYGNEWGGVYLETTLLMCFLCLACCWLGYCRRPHPALLEKLNLSIDTGRFLHGGILLILVGWYFTYKFGTLPEEELASMMTGIGTIYLFFSGLVYPGFAICFYCALKQRRIFPWLAAGVATIVPLQAAFFYGRREPTVLFLLSLGLGLYFTRGKRAPRWVIITAIVVAAFGIPATSEYRQRAKDDPLAALREIDFAEEFRESLDPEAISELKNATALIAATEATGNYEFGAGYWNRLVFRFVPAQFVGKEFKESLMIGGQQRDYGDFIEDVLGFGVPPGTTVTGIGDSFNQFGYFGCLFFSALGYLFKTLWAAANRPNGIVAQILYTQVATSAMRAATHQTIDFLPGFIYGAIFIWAVAFYARDRRIPHVSIPSVRTPAELLSK